MAGIFFAFPQRELILGNLELDLHGRTRNAHFSDLNAASNLKEDETFLSLVKTKLTIPRLLYT